MKPLTVDMLRAHLLVASLAATGEQFFTLIAALVCRVPRQFFSEAPFRLFALAVIVGGVVVVREFAQAAFDDAAQHGRIRAVVHGQPAYEAAFAVANVVAADCPRRWLIVLHLRLTGQPFVLAER